MFKSGMYVRIPFDHEYPSEPREFYTGKIVSIDEYRKTAEIDLLDPFNYQQYFYFNNMHFESVPLQALVHSHLIKGEQVQFKQTTARVIENGAKEDDYYTYYLQDDITKEYFTASEKDIIASFISGDSEPVKQLMRYEFQNPAWYLGRQVVIRTDNFLNNSVEGFRDLAGSKIYLKAFQLNTIMLCLQSDPCRYMIADEVGLGKTIEASSILKIFLKDKVAQDVLILVPQELLAQWKSELLFKFGLYEGEDDNGNTIYFKTFDNIDSETLRVNWDFVIVDEVHNTLHDSELYHYVFQISENAENILLLSATPIQEREKEYKMLMGLLYPDRFGRMSENEFNVLLNKQRKILDKAHQILNDLDILKNEILPDIEEDEDPHDNEDVQDIEEEILEYFDEFGEDIDDPKLLELIKSIDTSKEDLGIYDMQVAISYVCDNYQLSRHLIRGRRATLGVYPDPDAEFSKRELSELKYNLDEDKNYYEYKAYKALEDWIESIQGDITDEEMMNEVEPIFMAFFSSPWAYTEKLSKTSLSIPDDVQESCHRWLVDENDAVDNLSDIMDDVDSHPSRLVRLIDYVDEHLFGKKVVIFTSEEETFNEYYKVFYQAFGDEVTAYGKSIPQDEAEINIYRFQSEPDCHILLCDASGGEGRNLQIADYVVHVDLPWNINELEQRIGRLDRLGRNVSVPVTSIVIHTVDTMEEQLFNFWNKGLNVFCQSLSGMEIIMGEVNRKIAAAVRDDFEYGLENLVPELIDEASKIREQVKRESVLDTMALRYEPLYIRMNVLLTDYQSNENDLFGRTMMSWAGLAGFNAYSIKDTNLVVFDENSFSAKSAENTALIPPEWKNYEAKKKNESEIRVQRGYEEQKEKNVSHSARKIIGTFDRETAIKNDYIHFYAPGDDIYDCIVKNAVNSYKGRCSAIGAISNINWQGFVYTFSISPDEMMLEKNGYSLHTLGILRQYLASNLVYVAVPFEQNSDVSENLVLRELRRLENMGYRKGDLGIIHLGRRGKSKDTYDSLGAMSNAEFMRMQFPEDEWKAEVLRTSKEAIHVAQSRFKQMSHLDEAQDLIEQILASEEAREKYYGTSSSINELKDEYAVVMKSLKRPLIRIESAAFLWLKTKW